jgi:hypothetical protein
MLASAPTHSEECAMRDEKPAIAPSYYGQKPLHFPRLRLQNLAGANPFAVRQFAAALWCLCGTDLSVNIFLVFRNADPAMQRQCYGVGLRKLKPEKRQQAPQAKGCCG